MTDPTTVDLTAAQAALRGYAAVTLDPRIIRRAINTEPDLTEIATEYGWVDPEVTDKLFAIICTQLLGITYSEQTARFWSRRPSLEDDEQAANDRWVADNPAGQLCPPPPITRTPTLATAAPNATAAASGCFPSSTPARGCP